MITNVDPGLLAEFIDESHESLATIDSLLLELESQPSNSDIINAIFRPIHTLKGNSAYFGLLETKNLAHRMENILDGIRNHRLTVSASTIQTLLGALDFLKSILHMVRTTHTEKIDPADADRYAFLITKLENLNAKKAAKPEEILISVLRSLDAITANAEQSTAESLRNLSTFIKNTLPAVTATVPAEQLSGSKPDELESLEQILVQPFEKFLDDTQSSAVADLFDRLVPKSGGSQTEAICNQCIDAYKTMVGTVGFTPLLRELLLEKIQQLKEIGLWKEIRRQTPDAVQKKENPAEISVEKTMRVSESSIDTFLAFVGELISIEELFKQMQKTLLDAKVNFELLRSFNHAIESFALLSKNLRTSIMKIRKVPIKNLLKKGQRIVHDIAISGQKNIELKIQGEDIEVDKSIFSILDAPFIHLVRNAADHGIESPEVRKSAGKPAAGNLVIAVEESSRELLLTVKDDGAGINYEKIREKALSMNLISSSQILTKEQLQNLLFHAGVSTATKITEFSGRGVGMDVVKRTIESAGGSISIASTAGKGSQFSIKVPLSMGTQIIDGFCIASHGTCFILPIDCVVESFSVDATSYFQILGSSKVVVRHNQTLPVISLEVLLHLSNDQDTLLATQTKDTEKIVTLRVKNKFYAIIVDELLGIQKTMVKPIEWLNQYDSSIIGGSIQGDGSVALVFNEDGLDKLLKSITFKQ
ncbi:MAG: chemotaxis protein CheA [Chitinivibrionales bacterium]|nr:chemotaxis protein CheA [Chitinivibrionales bacterium]